MYVHNLNPVLINLGPISIRYYGLVYALGFLLALYVLAKYAKNKKIKNLDVEKSYDYILYLIIGSIIGGRLFFELFYNFSSFIKNPLQFFYIWQGGMAFHGGLIGAMIATYYFCKKNKVRFYSIADPLAIVLSFVLIFGRIANFINGELWGNVTNVSWGVKFPNVEGARHPSQLYEAMKNVIIFTTLMIMNRYKLKEGTIFWTFVGMYGLLRFIVTFYREAEYYFLGIGLGQWLSLAMVPIAIYMLVKN